MSFVLSQQPKQGKAALSSLQSVVLSNYFPTDPGKALDRLRGTELANAREALVRGFIDDLVFGLVTKGNDYYSKPAAIVAVQSTIEIRRDIALPRAVEDVQKILATGDDNAIHITAVLSLRVPEIAEKLGEAAQGTLRGWLNTTDLQGLVNAIRRSLSIAWLRDEALARIQDLTPEHYAIINGDPPKEILDRAVELYISSKNWDEANSIAADCAIPFAGVFSEEQIRLIFESAKKGDADLIGSHGFSEFVRKIFSENPISSQRLNEILDEFDLEQYQVDVDDDDEDIPF